MTDLLTAQDVAERLGVTKHWVWEQARADRIPHLRLGRHLRFREEAIEAGWIELESTGSTRNASSSRRASAPGPVVEVAHRRLDGRVAHPRLDLQDRRALDRERPERVAQVVQTEFAQTRLLQRRLVALAQSLAVLEATQRTGEYEGVLAGEVLAVAESRDRLGDLGDERDGADLAALGRREAAVQRCSCAGRGSPGR